MKKVLTVEEVIHTIVVTRDTPDKSADEQIVEKVVNKALQVGGIEREAAIEVIKHAHPEPYISFTVPLVKPSSY